MVLFLAAAGRGPATDCQQWEAPVCAPQPDGAMTLINVAARRQRRPTGKPGCAADGDSVGAHRGGFAGKRRCWLRQFHGSACDIPSHEQLRIFNAPC